MTLVHALVERPTNAGLIPARGTHVWEPTRRRIDPPTGIVMPSRFSAKIGGDYLDIDGTTVITAGEPGEYWIEIEPSTSEWAWKVTERVDGADRVRWYAVPDEALVEYVDLVEVDPDTLDPEVEPEAAWTVELDLVEARVDLLEGGTASLPPGGATGEVLTKQSGTDGDADWQTASGGVASVNTKTGAVVLNPDDLSDTATTNKFVTAADKTKLSNLTGTNSGDQDLSGLVPSTRTVAGKPLSSNVTLVPGDVGAATAAQGATADAAAADLATHEADVANPHTVTKSQVGLSNADNTSDVAKPVSSATQTALNAKADTSSLATVATSGDAGDLTGTLPSAVLPPLGITDTTVVADQAAMLALTAQRGDVAIRTDNSKTYILSTDSPTTLADWKELTATGAVSSVAGKTGTVSLDKTDVGLSNVDNTADASKPISSATQSALDLKANDSALTSHTSDTANPHAVTKAQVGLGSVDNTADTAKPVSSAQQSALDLKAPLASPAFTGTPTGITKTHVGLANVDNTSDANKPISDDTQDALDLKADASGVGEVARAVDYANTAQALTVNAYTPLSLLIAIPPTTQPIAVYYGASMTVTAAGNGVIGIGIADVTAGTFVETGLYALGSAFLAGTFSALQSLHGQKTLPPSSTWRFFRLLGALYRDGGSTLNATVAPSTAAGGSTDNRNPYLRAVLG